MYTYECVGLLLVHGIGIHVKRFTCTRIGTYLYSSTVHLLHQYVGRSPTCKTFYSYMYVCDIEGDPAVKVNPKAEYILEQRPYYVDFDDDD